MLCYQRSKCWAALMVMVLGLVVAGPLIGGCDSAPTGAGPNIDPGAPTDSIPPAPGSTHRVMVVATTGPKAIEAGLQVMQEGGSAADAVLTTALSQIALAAGSWVSYAGRTMVIYYEASTGEIHALDATMRTVRGETDPLSIPSQPTPSGRTALVPGFMAGVQALHDRFGQVSFARLFEPAIALAEDGVIIDRDVYLSRIIQNRQNVLGRLPETRAIFTKSNGQFYGAGDTFRQPALAQTLRKVAEAGAGYMYTGAWAEKLVQLVQQEGGHMTMQDLAAYEAQWVSPIEETYRDYVIYAPPRPHFGGVSIQQAFNILELADLKQHGLHYRTSTEGLYWFMQAIGPFFNGAAGMQDLNLSNDTRGDKHAAEAIWQRLQQMGKNAGSMVPSHGHSDAVVAVDAEGNVAAMLHTINTLGWGTTGIFVDGVSIPDAASFQQATVQSVGPGERMPHASAPLIIFKDGKPFVASSATGGGIHHASVQALLNILDYGMLPQQAEDMPDFWPVSGSNAMVVSPGAFSTSILNQIRSRGQPVNVDASLSGGVLGYWVGIRIDPETGYVDGGVTRRLDGVVMGY